MSAPFYVFASGVVINEVMFDPVENNTGNEWIELYNSGDQDADISGWELYPDGTGYVTIPNGFSIVAKKFMLIHLRFSGNNSPTDVYQTNSSSNMSNTSGSAALFSASPRGKDTIKSFVQWGRPGETWESTAADDGIWDKGTFIDLASFAAGNTVALQQDGVAAGGKNAWHVSNMPTPKAANMGSSSSGSPTPSAASSASASPLPYTESSAGPSSAISHASPVKTIKAYGGEDVSSMVGTMINFLGRAKGLNDESIDSSARFVWNFGDGETQEGRSVVHTYRIPGTYMLGLYVSSGEYAASDYMRVQIVPNLVSVSGVVWGIDGYMRFANSSDIEADIGGWSIRDARGHEFVVPSHTMMARRGDIAISNSVSGLLQEAAWVPLNIFYPNGALAFTYGGTTSVAVTEKTTENNRAELQDMPKAVPSSEVNTARITHPSQSVTASPSDNPSSASDTKEYATADHAPLVSVPFMIAIAISMLGAGGFLISKKFF